MLFQISDLIFSTVFKIMEKSLIIKRRRKMNSLISADNTWALWCILAVCSAAAIYLEQKYDWASKVTGCILALSFVMILSNFNIIPTEAPVYDHVW